MFDTFTPLYARKLIQHVFVERCGIFFVNVSQLFAMFVNYGAFHTNVDEHLPEFREMLRICSAIYTILRRNSKILTDSGSRLAKKYQRYDPVSTDFHRLGLSDRK